MSTKLSPLPVDNTPFWREKLSMHRVGRGMPREMPDKAKRLDDFGAEILDPVPLTVPAFLEPLGKRIERLTRLGKLRQEEMFDFDDDDDEIGDDLGDDILTPFEAVGGDFDHLAPKKRSKKPAEEPKLVSATTLPGGGAEPLPTSVETPPEPSQKA